jgi:hypothetical protein
MDDVDLTRPARAPGARALARSHRLTALQPMLGA